MLSHDTAYIERSNGRWEAWTYSDGDRVVVSRGWNLDILRHSLELRGFSVVVVS